MDQVYQIFTGLAIFTLIIVAAVIYVYLCLKAYIEDVEEEFDTINTQLIHTANAIDRVEKRLSSIAEDFNEN